MKVNQNNEHTVNIAKRFTVTDSLEREHRDLSNAIEAFSQYSSRDLEDTLNEESKVIYKFSENFDTNAGTIISAKDIYEPYDLDEVMDLINTGMIEPDLKHYEEFMQEILEAGGPLGYALIICKKPENVEETIDHIKEVINECTEDLVHGDDFKVFTDIYHKTIYCLKVGKDSVLMVDNFWETHSDGVFK